MDNYHTEKRLQLLANGYAILPNESKICRLKGWNAADWVARELTSSGKGSAADKVKRWPKRFPAFKATGVRLENGLGAIDLDVDDEKLSQLAWAAVEAVVPDVAARAPVRYGGGTFKAALFVRTGGEIFGRIASRKYNGHQIEIFGGASSSGKCSRQFGIYGPHSEGRDYLWSDHVPDLACTPVGELPSVTLKQAHAIVDHFDRAAVAAGYKPEMAPDHGNATQVYDIDETTLFDTDRAGKQLSYAELSEAHTAYGDMRCSSSFMEGRAGTNPERCWVFHSERHDCVAVFVYGDEQTHYPKQYAPIDPAVLHERLAAVKAPDPASAEGPGQPPSGEGTTLWQRVEWLLGAYGYCAATDTVVELQEASDECQMRVIGFQRLYRAWFEETEGPRGGIQRAYATAAWEVHGKRINVRGVRMRPDMPFPLYAEGEALFKNTYRRPQHTEGGGDIAPWLAFMEHLLPAPVEREWFMHWLAHKHRFPGVPGVAVVMVAANDAGPVYGAGRGLLRDIIARLLGSKYVRPIDFDVFSGTSAQSVYTDWAAYAVMVTVNEAKDTPDSGRWASRRAVYERLKELVDPRAIERTFTPKGRPAFTGRSFASYLIFSNNRDALQIPADDRRACALLNGPRMAAEMAAGLQVWMDDPANIAALARFLEARELTGFDAYTPLHTDAKATMQDLARSELDEAFDAVRATIGPRGLFTSEMLMAAILVELADRSEGAVRSVKRMVRVASRRIKIEVRMPPSAGRHWITSWRDHDTAHITDIVAAQLAVEHTGRRLAETHGPIGVMGHLPR